MPRPDKPTTALPGAVLLPTYVARCESCEESTLHAGLADDDGRELGSHCLYCGTPSTAHAGYIAGLKDWRDDATERARFEAHADRRGWMDTQSDLLRASGE